MCRDPSTPRGSDTKWPNHPRCDVSHGQVPHLGDRRLPARGGQPCWPVVVAHVRVRSAVALAVKHAEDEAPREAVDSVAADVAVRVPVVEIALAGPRREFSIHLGDRRGNAAKSVAFLEEC